MEIKHSYSSVPCDLDINNSFRAFENMTNSVSNTKLKVSNLNCNRNNDPESQTQTGLLKNKVRKYEVFPGRNRFCCDGRIMLATQTGIFYFTLFLIIATSACFFSDSRYTWEYMHPLVPIAAALQFIFVVVVLCRTALGDPGVIPRASPAEAAAIEKLIEREQAAEQAKTNSTLPYRPPPRIRNVTVNGRPFKLKFCYTCKIFRPPRASHCSVCDNCVDRFDHHCPWVGNCVGRRNYKYFYLFLTSLTVYCAYLMAVTISAVVLRSKALGFAKAMEQGPLNPVVAVIAFFSIWSVAGLGGFHTYLAALNMTTNEDIKGTFKLTNGGNPYASDSYFTNCAIVLCGPNPPSLIDRRGWVSDNDLPPMDKPPTSVNSHIAGNSTVGSLQSSPAANTNVNASAGGAGTPGGAVGYSASAGGIKGDINIQSTSTTEYQSKSSETSQISNGRGHSINAPKYLPPIERHHAPQASNQNREYLT